MWRCRRLNLLVFSILFLFLTGNVTAQENAQFLYSRGMRNGSLLYNISRFHEAAMEFRIAQENADNSNDWSRAIYWVILSQLAYSDYGSALNDMDELQRRAPSSTHNRDMVFHRARVYYNQGFFEDALVLFNRYINSTSDSDRESIDRRAAAFFWMGECLYSMSHFDDAERFYAWVIGRYPDSPRYEAAAYRIDLIKQKKIEAELLALLQWSHEESLRTSEDYQRTLRTYEHTLNVYQRRIAELINSINSPEVNNNNETNESDSISRIEYFRVPEENIPAPLFVQQNQNENLIERARQLGFNVQEILKEYEGGF
ncbi:MAG: tetratricopeptide repeat protein [Treponema sp.]|nr:tetratricopeptide repeat protein [Treponema sp.]